MEGDDRVYEFIKGLPKGTLRRLGGTPAVGVTEEKCWNPFLRIRPKAFLVGWIRAPSKIQEHGEDQDQVWF
jgi:hypothetical protein